jgi:hypothetical protein
VRDELALAWLEGDRGTCSGDIGGNSGADLGTGESGMAPRTYGLHPGPEPEGPGEFSSISEDRLLPLPAPPPPPLLPLRRPLEVKGTASPPLP